MIRLLLLLLFFSLGIHCLRRRCSNTGTLFPDKILRSPFVIYGESLGKQIYHETDTELLFNVTFRVHCILKGDSIDQRLQITNAGIQANRTACQWLDPGRDYIVFLEKCGEVFCPMDFQERIVDEITDELLERTCQLVRLPPRNSTMGQCPNVSVTEFCPTETKILPKSHVFLSDPTPRMRIFLNNVTQFSEPSHIKQIADNPKNAASLLVLFVSVICLSTSLHFLL